MFTTDRHKMTINLRFTTDKTQNYDKLNVYNRQDTK